MSTTDTSKPAKDSDTGNPLCFVLKLIALFALVAVLMGGYGTWAWYRFCSLEERGQFGDMFGAVNALFTGLAFVVLIWTLWLQRIELRLQQLELKETRKELRRSATAQEKAEQALTAQVAAMKKFADAATDSAAANEATARAQLWLEAQRIIRLPEFYDARKRVLGQEAPLRATEWSEGSPKGGATEEDARTVCRDMDQVAWLVMLQRFPEAIPPNIWEDTFSKAWIVLKLLVRHEQQSRGPGDKWSAFAKVGEDALKKLRWPSGSPKPSDDLLNELGWNWEEVRAKPA